MQGEQPDQHDPAARREGRDPAAAALVAQAMRAKLCAMLGRSLRVDASTAHYYMEEARGDIKAAMRMYGECARLELCSLAIAAACGTAVSGTAS